MLRGLFSLYSWRLPLLLLNLLTAKEYHAWAYLRAFWRTSDLTRPTPGPRQSTSVWPALCLYAVALLEIMFGLTYLWLWYAYDVPGGLEFGLALIIGYPLVLAHLLVVPILFWRLLQPKATGKALLTAMLVRQVVRLRKRHKIKVIGVVGSVGKTSTKIAIARLLNTTHRVQWQEGNYNDPVTVPLIFFGHAQPGILHIPAWIRILLANERMIRRPYPYQFVVAELGTDTPGTMRQFAYLKPDLVVVTAITPEHMESFGTLDAVAKEELTALGYAKRSLVNGDDTPATYLQRKKYSTYGLTSKATYYTSKRASSHLAGQTVTFHLDKRLTLRATISLLGDQGAKAAVAAVATAHMFGLSIDDIKAGIPAIAAFAGRMQVLPGIKNSTLIDDTYNATPIAIKAALDVLYDGTAPQRIAILGSMNELGDYTAAAHREVGEYCDPSKLDYVVTIGHAARTYLAPAAKEQGCTVKSFTSPYKAGDFVAQKLKEGAVVLAKGSQNRVFAEEALKILLADPADAPKLVRQSKYWLAVKSKQYKP